MSTLSQRQMTGSVLICRLWYEGQSKSPWAELQLILLIGSVGKSVLITNGNSQPVTRASIQKNVRLMYSVFCPVSNQLWKVLMEETACEKRTCECQMLKEVFAFRQSL